VASAYLRTIEFKVKDQALKQAVNKLGKSLGSIDKSVVAINKQFGNLSKSLKGVSTEFKQISKSAKELARTSATSKSSLDPKALNRSAIGLRKIKILLKDLANTSSLLDQDKRKFGSFNAAARDLGNFIKKIAETNKALASNEAILKRQISALATAANNASIGGALYVSSVQAQTKAEQALRLAQLQRISAQSKLYATGGFDTPKGFKGNQQLLGMEGKIANNIASLSLYRSELQKALSLVDLNGEEYKQIDIVIGRINERLNATNQLKKEELNTTEKTEKTERNRLRNQKSIFDQTANIGKRMRGDIQTLLGIGKLNLNVFSGKAAGSWFNQSAHIIGLADGIQRVIKRMNLLQTGWGRNTKAIAEFVQRGVEGFTALRIGAIGLNAVLGGADWVVGAVKGFVQFENAAANVIWSIERNYQSAFTSIGRLVRELPEIAAAAAYAMPQIFGGPGLAWDAMRPSGMEIDRVIDNVAGDRLGQRRPSRMQRMEAVVQKKSRRLAGLDPEDARFASLKREILGWEAKITQEKAKQLEISGLLVGQVSRKEQIAARAALAAQKAETLEIEKQLDASMRLGQQRKREAAFVPGRGRRDPVTGERGDFVNRDVWNRYQRMKNSRAMRLQRAADENAMAQSRFRENLMLGAGFPMLFGGGLGSVAGGTAGAMLQSRMGAGKGFGAQILLSAVGQQLDAFVAKVNELGKALRNPTENISALVQASGLVGTALGKQVQKLEKLGRKASAAALVTDRLKIILGEQGFQNLQKFSREWEEFSNLISIATTRLMGFVSGPLAFLVDVLQFIEQGNRAKAAMKDATNQFNKENNIPKWRSFLGNVMTGGMGTPMFSGEEGTQEWRNSVRENLNKDPGAANKAIDARIAAMQNIDIEILEKKTKLEKEKLTLKEGQFELESKEIDIARQQLEIEWQSKELIIAANLAKETGNYTEVENLELKIKRLIAQRNLNEAEYQNMLNLNKINDKYREIGQTIKDGIVDAIESAVEGTKTLGEVASQVLKQIAKQILTSGVNSFFNTLGNKNQGNWLGSLFGGQRAKGGPVTGGTSYLVGEKGPELFTPKSSGHITANDGLGGSVINVSVDANGSSAEGDADKGRELGRMLGAAIQAELLKQQRPGGILSR
jgi:hypothetical protein